MSRRKSRYLKIFVPLVIFIGIIIWVVLWAGSSSKGTISSAPTTKGPTTYTDKTLDGTYTSFTYSGKYMARTDAAKDSDLERYTLTADTRYDKRILVSISELSDGQLTSNGSYIYRQKTPTLYVSRTVSLESGSVTIWVKKDGTEQTAFLQHGTRVAIISFVTANTSEDLTNEVDALLNSFQWKK